MDQKGIYRTVIAAILLLAPVVYAANSQVVERGWQPVITLAGAGDSPRAVRTLREIAKLWGVALRNTEVDVGTRQFLERATSSLEDFNLKRLYAMLPEKDGAYHQLSVSGAFDAAHTQYRITRAADPKLMVGPEGTRQQIGDASLTLRASPIAAADGDTNYLMSGRAGIAIGPITWPMVVDGAQQFLHLLSKANTDPALRPMVASRQTILSRNPRLGAEDVEPIATLWEAFPRMGNLLSALGGVDDLVSDPVPATPGVERMRAVLHFDPERMKQRFPELASYLKGLDKLLEADVRWVDAQGRTLATLHLESKHLSAKLELYTKDGLLVPSRGNNVFVDQPLEAAVGKFSYSVLASANFRLLGVYTQMRAARVDFEHERSERGLQLRAAMKQVPKVAVSGAALGIVPTGVIDMFIPGDIQGLIEMSLGTACKGNGGQGITFDVRYDTRAESPGNSTLSGTLTFEAIDNFLVKLGFGYFSDHLLPNAEVRANTKHLFTELQSAFSADLERYARAAQ